MKKILIAVCAALWCALPYPVPAAQPPRNVLIVQSYHPAMPWTWQCETGISAALEPDYHLAIFYMDTKRIPKSQFQTQTEKAFRRFREIRPDLVMIGDDNALRLLGPRIAETKVPIVFFGINNSPDLYFGTPIPENITGVLEKLPIFPWLRYLKQILPGARNMLFLMDKSATTDAIIKSNALTEWHTSSIGITLEYKTIGTWDAWQETVQSAGKYDTLILPTFHTVKDAYGLTIPVMRLIRWTSAHSPVPVFSYQDYTVGDKGLAGAYVINGKSHGRRAAEMARTILEGKKTPKQLAPVSDENGQFFFNRPQLNRFHIVLPGDIAKQATFK